MADEVKEAVGAESAPATETQEVVKEAPATEGQTTTEQVQETTQTPPAGKQEYEAVDETGVPWKNRAFEWKRKNEETIERIPSLIDEAFKNNFQQYGKTQQREYTIAELEQFAQANPDHRPWVEEQKFKLLEERQAKRIKQETDAERQRLLNEQYRGQAFNYVANTYPELFVKNQKGEILGVNQQSPMKAVIDRYMANPEFANNPFGLRVAADAAYGEVLRSQQGANQLKEQKLKAEVAHLQKQTLVEGGGKASVQSVPEHRKAIDKAKQSGKIQDVADAIGAILKAKTQ
jgi:hypothetical protein